MNKIRTVDIQVLPNGEGLDLPAYATAGAAAMDLRAAVPEDQPLVIPHLGCEIVPLGFALALPPGYEFQVRARSGLARKKVLIANSPGTVDEDYTTDGDGNPLEVGAIVFNLSGKDLIVRRGERIAQGVLAALSYIHWNPVERLPARGRRGGFGSTGTA